MSAFDKVIGYYDVKRTLDRYCDVFLTPDLFTKFGVSMPNGILLCGMPGVGKTLMANCFIEETRCKAFTLRKEKPNGAFINEIKKTYEKAKAEGTAIVFLDDLDKFANEDEQHRNAEEYVAVQSCMDDCKGTGVFTLATVNEKYCLPESLLRAGRFDKIIEMYPPKGEDARLIIEHYLNGMQFVGDIDTHEIARLMEGKSCADLEAVIKEAGLYAAYEEADEIGQDDIVKACLRLIYNLPEYTNIQSKEELDRIALHEAGHAVVAEVLYPGIVSLVSVCKNSRAIEGMTKNTAHYKYNFSKTVQEHDAMCALGGKAAVEVVLGEVDVGCKDDMRKAFSIVSDFVDDDCAYGFDTYEGPNSSQELLKRKDEKIAYDIDRLYRQAKKIIIDNRKFLDAIRQELTDKKVILHWDMYEIRKRVFPDN